MPTLEELVTKFAENVAAQEEAIRSGDYRRGNRSAKAYLVAFRDLRKHGDPGREALSKLLSDSRDSVRAMAAAFLLRYRTSEAQAIFENIARGTGMV
jgi:hypothetical protein